MCFLKYLFIFCLLFFNVHALNCRSDGGPKNSELKTIYAKCLKMQDGKNSSNNRDHSSDHDWKEPRRNQRNDWERDQMGNDRDKSRDRMDRNDRRGADSRMGGYDDRSSNNDDRRNGYGDSMSSYDRMGSYDDRMDSSDRMSGRDRMDSYGRDSMGNKDNRHGRENVNGRNDFRQDEYGSSMNDQYGHTTQSSQRYKRERKTENSGQRSQFNPNSRKSSGHDDYNSSENSTNKEDEKRACALHCFLENLKMTAEDGMPDRYLVTHTLTKDVTNEDLKDFLQESIEECFQILDNENTDDKCEFSKNLMMCLSEKGRANCDDWKDDLRF